jgi:Uncharacterized protein conserved in bacteria
MNILRINELAKKAKEVGLTDEEKLEQEILRREYIEATKASLQRELDRTYIVDRFGVKRPIKRGK